MRSTLRASRVSVAQVLEDLVFCLVPVAVFAVAALGLYAAWLVARAWQRRLGRRWEATASALGLALRLPDAWELSLRAKIRPWPEPTELWLYRRGQPSVVPVASGLWRGARATVQLGARSVGTYGRGTRLRHTLVGVEFERSLRLGLVSPYEVWREDRSFFPPKPTDAAELFGVLFGSGPVQRLPPQPDGWSVTATDEALYLVQEKYCFDAARLGAALDWLTVAAPVILAARSSIPPSSAERALIERAPGWSARSGLPLDGTVLAGVRGAAPVEIACALEPLRAFDAPVLHTVFTAHLGATLPLCLRLATGGAAHTRVRAGMAGKHGLFVAAGEGLEHLAHPAVSALLARLGAVPAILLLPRKVIVYVEGAPAPDTCAALADCTTALARALTECVRSS